MKKIVGIIAALALAGSVFAGEPSVSPVILDFTGNASLDWIANLDAETIGMKNTYEAKFKVAFISEGTKATTGEGLWGELEIKEGKDEQEATYKNDGGVETKTPKSGTAVAAPSVEKAIIHFVDDDFYASMDIKGPDLGLGGGDLFLATKSKTSYPSTSVTLTGAQGFKINFGMKDLFDANFSFADDGEDVMERKDFGFKFDATLKAVENLEIYGGVAYTSEEEKVAMAAKASYKLDLGDFYLRPSVGFTLKDKAKNLAGALMFGWADEGEGADANFAKFTTLKTSFTAAEKALMEAGYVTMGMTAAEAKAAVAKDEAFLASMYGNTVPNKVNNGVSVMISSTLEDKAGIDILVGAYDDKLIAGFLPGFKAGAQFFANTETMKDAWLFDAAIAYSNTFVDTWTIDANFGVKVVHAGDDTDAGFLYGFGISTDNTFIQNTKLYAKYVGETAKDLGGANLKGTVTVGTQIHF
ncbi:MAG: hypothetical protein IKX70_08290 [Treponema sp.]|nr:hypothetical protein [Treponema sp.]